MRTLALLLLVTMMAPACTTTGFGRKPVTVPRDPALMRDYAQHLQIGSRIRARVQSGETLRGTLMKVTDEAVTVQPSARFPEPPIEVRFEQILRLELDDVRPRPDGTKAIGAAVLLGLAILLASLSTT